MEVCQVGVHSVTGACLPLQPPNPPLTTPSSAGALSPTTSITGQLQTEGEGLSGLGTGVLRQGQVWRPVGIYRSVLALGTVPGRLMSRSLRLWGRGKVGTLELEKGSPSPVLPNGKAGCYKPTPVLPKSPTHAVGGGGSLTFRPPPAQHHPLGSGSACCWPVSWP